MSDILPTHWLINYNHTVLRETLTEMASDAARDLCRPDARQTLGDEHDQCQHFFTKLFTIMQQNTDALTQALQCCSKVLDAVLMLGYYRSRIRRCSTAGGAQFIESETGADFALALDVDLPKFLQAKRSVLAQAKIFGSHSVPIRKDQLRTILQVAGAESAAYMLWDERTPPTIISATNIATYCRVHCTDRIAADILPLGRPFAEFLCDSFLALWFGKDYDSTLEGDIVPQGSIDVLYHFLHAAAPPPNVIYMGVGSAEKLRSRPGQVVVRLPEEDEEKDNKRMERDQ